ncbi:MAG TPA: ATPase [Elusimicrobia bacterium]|nr:ATPase [Elusimicrobiota bacterium]
MRNKNAKLLMGPLPVVMALCTSASAALPGAGEAVSAAGGNAVGLGFAAALTMALCVMGSAYAIGRIGSAAMGAAAEKPELLIRSLLFVALAEGLAVLGFVISMMMIQKI